MDITIGGKSYKLLETHWGYSRYASPHNPGIVVVRLNDSTAHGVCPGKGESTARITQGVYQLFLDCNGPRTATLNDGWHVTESCYLEARCTPIPYTVVVRRQAGSPTLQQGSNDSPPRLQVDFFGVPKTMRLPNVGDVCVPDNWLEQIRSGTRLAFLVLEKQWELLGWKLNSLKLHIGIDQDGCLRLTGPFDADSWQLSKIEGSPARRIPNDKSLGKAATRHRRTALLTQEFCKQRPTVLHVDCGPKQLTSNTGFRQEFKPPSLWGLGIEDRLLHVTKLERGNGSHGFWQERHFPLYISAPPRDWITIEDNFQMVVLYGERCFETAKLLSQSTTMPIIVVPDRDMAIERVGPSVTILTSMEAVVWHVARVLSASWPSVYAKTNLESSGGARE